VVFEEFIVKEHCGLYWDKKKEKMMVCHQLSPTFSSEEEGRSLQKDTGGSRDKVAHPTQSGAPQFFLCLILWLAGWKLA